MIAKSPYVDYFDLEKEALSTFGTPLRMQGYDVIADLFPTDYDEATGAPVIGALRLIDLSRIKDGEWCDSAMYTGEDVKVGLQRANDLMKERCLKAIETRKNQDNIAKALR